MTRITLDQFRALFGLPDVQATDGKYADRFDRQILCALSAVYRPHRVLEIGIQEGRTAELLLRVSPWIFRYVGIDVYHDFVPTLPIQRSEVPGEGAAARLAKSDPRLHTLLISGGTAAIECPNRDIGVCDLIYIDADHSYDGVKRDTELADQIINRSEPSVIVWHDYHPSLPGVVRLLDERAATHKRLVHVEATRIAFEILSP